MGEWRVFIERSEACDFDLWKALKLPPTVGPAAPTSRSDLYFVGTHDVGVKFRAEGSGCALLEVKVRLKRKKRGVEKWSKVLCAPVDCPDPRAFDAAAFRRELAAHGLLNGKHAAALAAVVSAWEREAPMRLSLVKERRQFHMPGSGVLVEQTDFVVLRDGAPLGPRFRTINMEASKAKHIYRVVQRLDLARLLEPQAFMLGCGGHRLCVRGEGDATGCITAGFPEFVALVRARYATSPEGGSRVGQSAPGSSSTVPTPPAEPLRSA